MCCLAIKHHCYVIAYQPKLIEPTSKSRNSGLKRYIALVLKFKSVE